MGRPRAFDVDKALGRAMEVFWRQGYEATSLTDLTEAMEINRPSLYAAFGNKEELFVKVLDRYLGEAGELIAGALAMPSAREGMAFLLQKTAERLGDPRTPPGCLAVHGALSCGKGDEAIRRKLAGACAGREALLRQRFERARREGELPAAADPAALAGYFNTFLTGLAVEGAQGASRAALRRAVQQAMLAWP
ncbi:MAG: TetR/AcrR family transcriptional regulator [Verrucomicrobium sp.]|nr:TetR/AcrR family transcriptional regulator [Verrucomicrobium sp.]